MFLCLARSLYYSTSYLCRRLNWSLLENRKELILAPPDPRLGSMLAYYPHSIGCWGGNCWRTLPWWYNDVRVIFKSMPRCHTANEIFMNLPFSPAWFRKTRWKLQQQWQCRRYRWHWWKMHEEKTEKTRIKYMAHSCTGSRFEWGHGSILVLIRLLNFNGFGYSLLFPYKLDMTRMPQYH